MCLNAISVSGKINHVISACKWTSGACFKCGPRKQMLRGCPNAIANCFKCGEAGHTTAGCVKRNMVPACGNCGERGHFYASMSKREDCLRSMCGKWA